MSEGKEFSYRELSLAEFIHQYESVMPKARLFELTMPWLSATAEHMLSAGSKLIVHCLFQENKRQESALVIAWPLVHNSSPKLHITSLTSFYSAVAEPIFFSSPCKENIQLLFTYIQQHHQWHSMQLGAFEEGVIAQALVEHFSYLRVFSRTDNVYQEGINDYASYCQQRPSQLRNTIKRREKKLSKTHQYRTEIIAEPNDFSSGFAAYKDIYRQSWKGDEFSFDFIEKVCLAALAENKLRLGLLYVNEEPAAAQLWFLQSSIDDSFTQGETEQLQTTASIFKLAYSPKYQQYSVGSILSLALSEHVINLDNVSTIEFGMGSEPYKKDWLKDTRKRQSYQIFNPRGFYGKLAIIRKLLLPQLIQKILGCIKGKTISHKGK